MAKKIKTLTTSDVINVTRNMGDTFATRFEESGDYKSAMGALASYKTAIGAAKALLFTQKQTGSPSSIPFLQ